jgi:hypothetical protein
MNETAKMLKERMDCGMMDESEIIELPDDGLAFVLQKDDVEIGIPGAAISISKESVLKIADKIRGLK